MDMINSTIKTKYDGNSWIDDDFVHPDEVSQDIDDRDLMESINQFPVSDDSHSCVDEDLSPQHFSDGSIVRSGIHDVEGDKDSFSMKAWNRFKFIPTGQFIVGSARHIVDEFSEMKMDKSVELQDKSVETDRGATIDFDLGIDNIKSDSEADFSR